MSVVKILRPANGGRDVFVVNDAILKYKNFSGKQGKFPGPDNRTVNVVIDAEDKMLLESLGKVVNTWVNKKDGSEEYTVRIRVKMLPGNSPRIVQYVGNNPTPSILTAETVEALDKCPIAHANIAWTYSNANPAGKPTAYLKEMEATIVPSIFSSDASDYYVESNG